MMNDIKWNNDQMFSYGDMKLKTDGNISVNGGVITITSANGLSLNDYQKQAASTAIYPDHLKILYPALGLGEAGEVQNKVKKIFRDDDGIVTPQRKQQIISEMGGTLWYLAALASDLDTTLEEIAQFNLNELSGRKERGTVKGDGDVR